MVWSFAVDTECKRTGQMMIMTDLVQVRTTIFVKWVKKRSYKGSVRKNVDNVYIKNTEYAYIAQADSFNLPKNVKS